MIAAEGTTGGTARGQKKPRRRAMHVIVPEWLREAMERIAAAAGYQDGVNELALETAIPSSIILDCVALSLVRVLALTPEQIAAVSLVAMEEKLRHGSDHASRWVAEKTLGLEVPRQ